MEQVIFKTDASLGKSILTSALPDSKRDKGCSDSVFDIAVDHGLKEIWVLEENCLSVFELNKNAIKLGIELRFGLQILVGDEKLSFKHAFFGKNAAGVKELFKLYTTIQTQHAGVLPMDEFDKITSENLHSAVPFYDSYLDKNLREFGNFVPAFKTEPVYFVESNELPFDKFLAAKIKKVSNNTMQVRSVFYRRREDFAAWQVYKITCSDKLSAGKRPTIDSPNLDGCGSNAFCFER